MRTCMTADIMMIDSWMRIEEMPSSIVSVNGKVPARVTPNYGAQEIIGSQEQIVLPIVQNISEVSKTNR